MSEAPEHLGVHEDPDALLSEMLGRPLGVGGTAIGGLVSMGSSMGHDVDEEKGAGYVPPLHHQPRLFNDPVRK